MKLIIVFIIAITLCELASCAVSKGGMLFPQESESRTLKDLSGIWKFKADFDNVGMKESWFSSPLSPTINMPVPASFNDITQDDKLRRHIGWVWYELDPLWIASEDDKRYVIRFESAHYYATAWLNGVKIVEHNGGHLPFEADVTALLKKNTVTKYRLTVAVNNTLSPTTLPPGKLTIQDGKDPRYPKGFTVLDTWFDFFNYAGIHRPVKLISTPLSYIDDITVNYKVSSTGEGTVLYDVTTQGPAVDNSGTLVTLYDHQGNAVAQQSSLKGSLTVPKARLWHPEDPYLYSLRISINNKTGKGDVYVLKSVGIRTIQVTPTQFLINNKPFYFHGVDKHEDADIRGKGLDYSTLIKDFNLLKWMNVNAVRTSHYPYAQEFYDLADQLGIVVIGESTAVGMNLEEFFSNATLSHHKDVMHEMIRRDKNHPSVVMWSVANEPASLTKTADTYFSAVAEYTRSVDPTDRPLTLVQSVDWTDPYTAAEYFDVVCVNRYYAWYSDSGAIELIPRQLSADLEGWYKRYNKPIIISEYGADTVPGLHSSPPVMFTEEYQSDFMATYQGVFDKYSHHFLVGELVWNFADFNTKQQVTRVMSRNYKGVLTRERQPKPAAFGLKARYEKLQNGKK